MYWLVFYVCVGYGSVGVVVCVVVFVGIVQ